MNSKYLLHPFYFWVLLGLSTGWLSCTKWTTVSPPNTEVTQAGAFSNDESAEATVAGLYSQIMTGNLYLFNGGTTLYPALSADELYNTSPDAAVDPFTQNALTARNFIISTDLWGKGYSYLYQENACLEGLNAATTLSNNMRSKLQGESHFMRALTLFYLTNLYGAIPLPLTTGYARNASLPRTDSAAVYQQILADLTAGESLLASAGVLSSEVRPSQMACITLKARVYLYQRDWENAAKAADTVINSGLYILAAPEAVFLAGSPETVFALSPVITGMNTSEGQAFIPYDHSVTPLYALQEPLLAAFESGDLRRTVWVDSSVVEGMTYYYPYKYKATWSDAFLENNVVLRLAELYLIRAEANTELNNIGEAVADVNIIRSRAGLAPIAAGLSQTALLNRVIQENRIEFFAEWGHRWLDLKRTGRADTVLAGEKNDWQSTDVLYPIPYSELLLNQHLTQNKGY